LTELIELNTCGGRYYLRVKLLDIEFLVKNMEMLKAVRIKCTISLFEKGLAPGSSEATGTSR
jgi:hypothetical protein